MGSGTVDVFATPMVAALMEGAACDLAARYIEDIYTTVGSKFVYSIYVQQRKELP